MHLQGWLTITAPLAAPKSKTCFPYVANMANQVLLGIGQGRFPRSGDAPIGSAHLLGMPGKRVHAFARMADLTAPLAAPKSKTCFPYVATMANQVLLRIGQGRFPRSGDALIHIGTLNGDARQACACICEDG